MEQRQSRFARHRAKRKRQFERMEAALRMLAGSKASNAQPQENVARIVTMAQIARAALEDGDA